MDVLLTYYVIDGDRFRIKKYRKKADRAYMNYMAAINPPTLEKEYGNYLNAQEKHNKAVKFAKNKLIIGIPALIAAYVGTWLQVKKINRKSLPEKPIFQPRPPFSKSNIEIGINSSGGGYELGFIITF